MLAIVDQKELLIDLNRQIEAMRSHMVSLGTKYDFLHPEVQICSKRLDRLLMEYYIASLHLQKY
ncbi:aspartyl-phosphate phosphatase Spo0E family protein [Paenibacillus sp. N1-5-1-14]|uniref:aspartyl-phosphate phosphatase Spo0E family protein n=1 Tax=Paenibacillus radicibacter TaxID=2972488 RepID=UPI0021599ACB|nr:aspartyl-phosphate phosphatase Spo0E family protein [Paenibacillus radicibacter]MCR8645264.1 aspartyl-phosphate phosphatase Spo0E family protein [Paenibacillus radicibacter]